MKTATKALKISRSDSHPNRPACEKCTEFEVVMNANFKWVPNCKAGNAFNPINCASYHDASKQSPDVSS